MSYTNRQLSSRGRASNLRFACLVLILMGGIFTYVFLIHPFIRVMQARNWVETQCLIISSSLGRHAGSKGMTYSVDIAFSYHIGAKSYLAEGYDLLGGRSSGYSWREAVVEEYPAGKRTVCYVNPSNPTEAVIYRDFPKEMPVGFVALALTLGGLAGVIVLNRQAKRTGMEYGQMLPGDVAAPEIEKEDG